MEKLVMYVSKTKEKSHSLLKVTPEVQKKVKALSEKLDRYPIDVASTLLEWALERVDVCVYHEEEGD